MEPAFKEFWKQRYYAVVGVSRKKHKFGTMIFSEMKKSGTDQQKPENDRELRNLCGCG